MSSGRSFCLRMKRPTSGAAFNPRSLSGRSKSASDASPQLDFAWRMRRSLFIARQGSLHRLSEFSSSPVRVLFITRRRRPARLFSLARVGGLVVVMLLARGLFRRLVRVCFRAGAVRGADGTQRRERRAARNALPGLALARVADDVVDGEEADEVAAAVNHGEASHLPARHRFERFAHVVNRRAGLDAARQDLRDAHLRRALPAHREGHADVAVCDNADDTPVLFDYGDDAAVAPPHDGGGIGERGIGPADLYVARHQTLDKHPSFSPPVKTPPPPARAGRVSEAWSLGAKSFITVAPRGKCRRFVARSVVVL